MSVALLAPTASAASTVSVTATTTVNVRTGPGLHYKVVGQLERGVRIRAYRPLGGTWLRVRFGGGEAYMARQYLTTATTIPGPVRTDASRTKITTVRLNLRSAADPASRVLGILPEGTRLRLTGKMTRGLAETRHGGKSRWVSLTYLARVFSGPAAAPRAPSTNRLGQTAYAFAAKQLGKPYRYGAAGPDAYDCSGLTSASWAKAGVKLPRTTARQFHIGRRVAKSDLRIGDLVFYYPPTPSHVGLYAGNGRIIHSPRPGKVVEHVPVDWMPYAGAVRPG